MKPAQILVPLVFLGVGSAAGWMLAQRDEAPAAPAAGAPAAAANTANAAKAANPAGARPVTSRDIVEAPKGGFDPAFVKVAAATKARVPDGTPISGKLAFDAEHLHLVSSRVAGRLDRILVFEGAKVGAGQPVAELYSPDWISAQNELLLARNTLRTLASAGQPDLLEDAKATEQSARNRMKVLGAADGDIAQVAKTGVVSNYLTLRAPIAGTVTKRNMDPGAFLNVGDNFMTVSDTSHVWFVGNIYEQDYARIKIGQTLELQAPALPGRTFRGTVNFIGTNLDPVTHTLPIRCTVPNGDGALRPELFVSATLVTGEKDVVVVPKAAVVTARQASYVFVEETQGRFRRVAVTASPLPDGRMAVASGLKGDEQVVVEGATLINEIMARQ